MKMDSFIKNELTSFYASPKFNRMLEMHLSTLKVDPDNMVVPVDPHDAYVFEGNFFGLLAKMGIDSDMHWLIMRLNNIKDPCNWNNEIITLILPNKQKSMMLGKVFMSGAKRELL